MRKRTARENLAINLRMLMVNRGFAGQQVAFAKKIGVSQSHVSQIRNRTHSVSLATLQKIADAMRVEPWQLLTPPEMFAKLIMPP